MPRHASRVVSLAAVALLCGAGVVTQRGSPPERSGESVYRLASLPQGVAVTAARPAPVPAQQPLDLSHARAFSEAFADVAAAVTPAVVQIQTERSLESLHRGRFHDLFERLPEGHPSPDVPHMADGSGFLVSEDGLILTNNHVIAGAERIRVVLWDKRTYEATVVGTDPTTDIALIVIDEGGLPHARLGDSDALRVGEWVLAIGNPGFRGDNTLDFTVTSGIVSAKGRPLDVIQSELSNDGDPAARYAIEDFIQTDAAINPGNSGGPLLDLAGQVVGVNTAIASVNGVNQGYGFAVPINVATRVVRDLLDHGRVRRPLLGISIQHVTPEDAEAYSLPRIAGVLVEDFAGESPARKAGLRRHDVIVALDGDPVDRLGQFQRLVASRDPGETVAVDVVRFGERLRFDVKLTEAELGSRQVVRTAPERRRERELGIELVELTPALARERRLDSGGALIASVDPGSAAERKRVPQGVVVREINRTAVGSAAEAERILDGLPPGSIASLLLELPGGETLIRNVRVP
ncbi:MAG: trypsin-like peptidase domain-containing protein [Gemmatimonadota bacterium]